MNEYTSHSTHQPEEIKMTECATYDTDQPQFSGDADYELVTDQPQSRGDEDYESATDL